MDRPHLTEPILKRYIIARYANEYLVPLFPVSPTIVHRQDAPYEISPRVVAVYFPTGMHFSNGEIEFEYVGIRIMP